MKNQNHLHRIEPERIPTGLSDEMQRLVDREREQTMLSMPTERVMRAISRSRSWRREHVLSSELINWFRPVALVGSMAVILMMLYNLQISSTLDYDQSAAEAVFGLPPVTVASAYHLSIDDH